MIRRRRVPYLVTLLASAALVGAIRVVGGHDIPRRLAELVPAPLRSTVAQGIIDGLPIAAVAPDAFPCPAATGTRGGETMALAERLAREGRPEDALEVLAAWLDAPPMVETVRGCVEAVRNGRGGPSREDARAALQALRAAAILAITVDGASGAVDAAPAARRTWARQAVACGRYIAGLDRAPWTPGLVLQAPGCVTTAGDVEATLIAAYLASPGFQDKPERFAKELKRTNRDAGRDDVLKRLIESGAARGAPQHLLWAVSNSERVWRGHGDQVADNPLLALALAVVLEELRPHVAPSMHVGSDALGATLVGEAAARLGEVHDGAREAFADAIAALWVRHTLRGRTLSRLPDELVGLASVEAREAVAAAIALETGAPIPGRSMPTIPVLPAPLALALLAVVWPVMMLLVLELRVLRDTATSFYHREARRRFREERR